MSGAKITLAAVAALAAAGAAGAVRKRGGRNHLPTLYHVTTREAADDILRNGFLPGWGDIGLGVYFYGSEREAMRYAQKGGWDGALRGEPVVVLSVQDAHIRRMGDADLDPSWDRSKYADMWFWEGQDEDAYMVPSRVSVAADLGVVAALAAAGAAGRRGSAAEEARLPFGASPRSRAMRQLLRRYDVRSEPEGPLALDVFAGAGGFGLGAQSVGVRTVGVERNPLAVRTARGAGLQTLEADVGELAGPGVPVDVLIGGPPCQPFSSAGKRRGQYDPRDGFGLFLDVVDAVRPRRLVAENVVAFLEPKHRAYREHIMSELAERYPYSGYWVLNARDFGVPQDRERVFIWASEDRALQKPRPRPGTRVRTVAQALPHLAAAGYDAVVPFQGGAKSRPTATRPSPTITTRRNLYAVVGAGRVWRGRGSIPTGPGKARLLRPDETLVLQGFPEGFDPVGNLEQQQCQIGNAVPPPLAAAVVEALTKGLKPRRLDAEELVESLAAIGATPRLLGPRPQADEALLGVLVDPPYLSGPGIVAVYDAARYRELTGRAARPGRSLDAPVVVDRESLSRQGISWRSWVGEHPDKRLAMLRG